MSDEILIFSPTQNAYLDVGNVEEKEIDKIRDNLLKQGLITWKIYIKGD